MQASLQESDNKKKSLQKSKKMLIKQAEGGGKLRRNQQIDGLRTPSATN